MSYRTNPILCHNEKIGLKRLELPVAPVAPICPIEEFRYAYGQYVRYLRNFNRTNNTGYTLVYIEIYIKISLC